MAKQVNIFKFFGSTSSKRNINVIKPKQHEKDEKIIRNVVSDLINDVVKGENKDKKSTTDFAYCLEKATRWKKRFTFWDTPNGKVSYTFFSGIKVSYS